MNRINVFVYDEDGASLAGWYDGDTVTETVPADAVTDLYPREQLVRTSGGRWVLVKEHRAGTTERSFLSLTDVKAWLAEHGATEVIARYFGLTADSKSHRGRPEVGQPIHVRLGDELLARVDAEAVRLGVTRAEMVRVLVDRALAS